MSSFGENLRRERELRGVSLREVADATKISVRFLDAIERDRLDTLPGGLFPRAFVRQYAAHLGLDPDRTVTEFVHASRDLLPAEQPRRTQEARPRRWLRNSLLLSCIALALSLVRARGERDAAAPVATAPPPAPAVLPSDRVYPPPVDASRSAEIDGLVLTLDARANCWVAAQVDGQTVINRVLSEGEKHTLQATGEIVLSVGNAGGLVLSVNDQPGLPLGRSGEVRRNIVINRETLASLVENAPSARAPHSS